MNSFLLIGDRYAFFIGSSKQENTQLLVDGGLVYIVPNFKIALNRVQSKTFSAYDLLNNDLYDATFHSRKFSKCLAMDNFLAICANGTFLADSVPNFIDVMHEDRGGDIDDNLEYLIKNYRAGDADEEVYKCLISNREFTYRYMSRLNSRVRSSFGLSGAYDELHKVFKDIPPTII